MFTLQVHNQALVLNAVNPRSYLSLRRFNLPEEKLEKSLLEVSKNCTELNLKEVPLQAVRSPFLINEVTQPSRRKKSQNMSDFFKNALRESMEHNPMFRDKMRVLMQKNSTKLTSQLAKSLVNKIVFSSGPSNIYFQIRNFKTDRCINAETLRNPSLITRIRSFLGIEDTATTTLKNDKFIIGSAELDRMRITLMSLDYKVWHFKHM